MDLGSKLGKIAGKATALLKETAQYKGEYEHMSINQLVNEYKAVQKSCHGIECKLRRTAIMAVLQERGYDIKRL